MHGYRLQGLLLTSNCPLPGLDESAEDSRPDVEFRAGQFPADLNVAELEKTEPAYASPYLGPGGGPFSRMWRCPRTGLYYFGFIYSFAFVVDSAGKTIWAQWSEPATLNDVTAFLLGRILAFVLHLRGHVCLHASAVAIDDAAVLFAGNPGMGKSSTAAAFSERGCPVLTDDVCAIRREAAGQTVVVPGIPRVCLLPDSVELLYGSRSVERFPRLFPDEDKRLLALDSAAGKFQTEPAPLEAIYLLDPRTADPDAPRIEDVAGGDRLIRLLDNGYMNLALDKDQKAREFRMLGEIARGIRIRRLVPSNDPKKLGRLCDLVVSDLRAGRASLAGRAH